MLPKSTLLLEKSTELDFARPLYIHTPALTAGAHNLAAQSASSEQLTAEVRLSSLLGPLRFWWRATAGRAYRSDERRRQEITVFGGPATEERVNGRGADRSSIGGTGCFTGSLMVSSQPVSLRNAPITTDGNLLQFFGNGVTTNRNGTVPIGQYGILTLHFHPRKDPAYRSEVLHALETMCAFGGIGLLSRRGLGSISTHAPGTRNLSDAISENNRLLADLARPQEDSSCGGYRLVNWPIETSDSLEALAQFAAHLKELRVKSDVQGNLERLSDVLSCQASWRRADKGGNRRPSPVSVKVQSCVHEGRPVQLITALLSPSAYSSDSIPGAPEPLTDRLGAILDSLDSVAAAARKNMSGAFA